MPRQKQEALILSINAFQKFVSEGLKHLWTIPQNNNFLNSNLFFYLGLFFPPIVPGFPRNGMEWLSKELFSTLPQTTPVPSPTPTDTSPQTEAPGFTAHSVGYNFNQHCYSAGEYSFHPVDVYSRGTSWCKVYFKIQTEICSHGSCTNPLWRRRSPSGRLQTNSIFSEYYNISEYYSQCGTKLPKIWAWF